MAKDESKVYLMLTNETKRFEDKVENLWDTYSGLPGLLSSTQPGSKYTYDPDKNQYRIVATNNLISEKQIRDAVDKVAEQQKMEMRKVTQQLIAGVIIASVWYLRMQDLMTVLYKTFWLLSIGGFLFDNDNLRNLFYLFVLMQYDRLDNFYEQIKNKSQPLDGTAMTRAGLYGSYGNSMYQNANKEKMETIGYTQAKRVLGKNENHCFNSRGRLGKRPGCVELAAQGWLPLQMVIPIGEASCYSNCHCHLIYR